MMFLTKIVSMVSADWIPLVILYQLLLGKTPKSVNPRVRSFPRVLPYMI